MRTGPILLALLATACGPAASPRAAEAQGSAPAPETRGQPETRGLDPAIMARTVEEAARLPRLRSLLVLRDGQALAEHRFNGGPTLETPVNVKSASKSVISALVGIAIGRGVLTGADQRALPLLRADAPGEPDPRLARLTVGDLLSMRAGLERTSGEYYGRWVSSPNWVRFALARPFVAEPGGPMLYSTGNTHLLSAILTRASGKSTLRLAREWLGEPLGIAVPSWPADPQGIYFGGNEMRLSPRALARFGELYRLDGIVNGMRVLPESWVRESWTPRVTSPWSGGQYGYGWFVGTVRGLADDHPVRFAWGYGGQMVYVLPDLGLTVVMTSQADGPRDSAHVAALHRLLATGIVPAAERGG